MPALFDLGAFRVAAPFDGAALLAEHGDGGVAIDGSAGVLLASLTFLLAETCSDTHLR